MAAEGCIETSGAIEDEDDAAEVEGRASSLCTNGSSTIVMLPECRRKEKKGSARGGRSCQRKGKRGTNESFLTHSCWRWPACVEKRGKGRQKTRCLVLEVAGGLNEGEGRHERSSYGSFVLEVAGGAEGLVLVMVNNS